MTLTSTFENCHLIHIWKLLYDRWVMSFIFFPTPCRTVPWGVRHRWRLFTHSVRRLIHPVREVLISSFFALFFWSLFIPISSPNTALLQTKLLRQFMFLNTTLCPSQPPSHNQNSPTISLLNSTLADLFSSVLLSRLLPWIHHRHSSFLSVLFSGLSLSTHFQGCKAISMCTLAIWLTA